MLAIKAHFDGHVFVPESPVSAEINQRAIITLIRSEPTYMLKKERLLSLAGSISHENYLELEKALEETERVYSNDW